MTYRIYVASSWRNEKQPYVVDALRSAGHEVYDFKNPKPGNSGFRWSDAGDVSDTISYAQTVIKSPIAQAGFQLDKQAMDWADTCVMVLPCGRSAHLEAGYMAGQGKFTIFLLSMDKFEPELMYLLGDSLCHSIRDVIVTLNHRKPRCAETRGY